MAVSVEIHIVKEPALLNAFKYQHLAKVLEPLYNSLSEALINDTADADFIEEWKNLFVSVLGGETEKLKAIGDAMGVDLFKVARVEALKL